MRGTVAKKLRRKAKDLWYSKQDPNFKIRQILKDLKRQYKEGVYGIIQP